MNVAAAIILKVNKRETESYCHLRVLPDGQIISHWRKKNLSLKDSFKTTAERSTALESNCNLKSATDVSLTMSQHSDSTTFFDCDASK